LPTEIWETGQELIHYMGPAPPEGLHRYVLLLFKQVSFNFALCFSGGIVV
jgi:phosphatidylethanolamine-binding protein (PEBP) family uncharacterized protein